MADTSNAAEVARNLAAWFGGTLFGQVALNPALGGIRATGGERSLVLLAAISVSGTIENEHINPRGTLSRLLTD